MTPKRVIQTSQGQLSKKPPASQPVSLSSRLGPLRHPIPHKNQKNNYFDDTEPRTDVRYHLIPTLRRDGHFTSDHSFTFTFKKCLCSRSHLPSTIYRLISSLVVQDRVDSIHRIHPSHRIQLSNVRQDKSRQRRRKKLKSSVPLRSTPRPGLGHTGGKKNQDTPTHSIPFHSIHSSKQLEEQSIAFVHSRIPSHQTLMKSGREGAERTNERTTL